MVLKQTLRTSFRFSSTSATQRLTRVPSKFNTTSSAGNVKPNYKPGLYHHPSPSIAKVDTPDAFLPLSDPRKGLNITGKPKVDIQNAPSLSTPREQKLNLTPKEVQEIQTLRMSEPEKWTRKALAKKFDVSPFTISLVSDANPDRKLEMQSRLQTIKASWGEKRQRARADREKRKVAWYRDE
jgi:hypothetical protein